MHGYLTRVENDYAVIEYDNEDGRYNHLVYANTVGQYTGLKDAKGNEIYEGDLLKSAFSKNVFGVVTLNEKGYFCIIPVNMLKDEYSSNNDFATLGYMLEKKIDGRSCEFTVISNIHDNPDLGIYFLRTFERNGISYELIQSEEITEDLDILKKNSPPLYDRVVKRIAKESLELNDFEKAAIDYKYGGHDPSLFDPGYFDTARNEATELLSLAREQFIKDGYVIEKKAFHDAVEKVDPEVMEQVSEAVDLSNFEYMMLRYVQEGANAKDDEELIELTKKYSKELHKYV